MITTIGIIIVLAIVVPLVRLMNSKAKKRDEEMQALAAGFGWNYNHLPPLSVIPGFERSYLGSQHAPKKVISNVISGQTNNLNVAVFDYIYEIFAGTTTKQHFQTMIFLQSSQLNLPQFLLRPEGWTYKMMKMGGYQDINFSAHPTFSSNYLLQGANEQIIRSAFNDRVLSFFENNPRLWVEGEGNQLLIYQLDIQIQPAEIRNSLQRAMMIHNIFQGN